MIITAELIGGIVSLAGTAAKLLERHFTPDPKLQEVKHLVVNIHTSLETAAIWTRGGTDVNEETFIEFMDKIARMIGELIMEIDRMLEKKKFLSRFGRNRQITSSSYLVSFKSAMPSFYFGKSAPLIEAEHAKPTLDSVISNFSNIETQLNAASTIVPNIENSVIFQYKGDMWVKNLTDFEIPDIYQLAKQDPVELSGMASIPRPLARNLVSYANML